MNFRAMGLSRDVPHGQQYSSNTVICMEQGRFTLLCGREASSCSRLMAARSVKSSVATAAQGTMAPLVGPSLLMAHGGSLNCILLRRDQDRVYGVGLRFWSHPVADLVCSEAVHLTGCQELE